MLCRDEVGNGRWVVGELNVVVVVVGPKETIERRLFDVPG